jgi:hypothetical protein
MREVVRSALVRPLRRAAGALLAPFPVLKERLRRIEARLAGRSVISEAPQPAEAIVYPPPRWRAARAADDLRRACAKLRGERP